MQSNFLDSEKRQPIIDYGSFVDGNGLLSENGKTQFGGGVILLRFDASAKERKNIVSF